jgi:hypothetical protein
MMSGKVEHGAMQGKLKLQGKPFEIGRWYLTLGATGQKKVGRDICGVLRDEVLHI